LMINCRKIFGDMSNYLTQFFLVSDQKLPISHAKNLIKNPPNNAGFSLIEAMVATLIMAISFAGVYSMTAYSSVTLKNSIDRQKMQLIANQILESISGDYANVNSYNNMSFITCNAPAVGETQTYHQNRYKWCRMLNDAVGTPAAGDVRAITVTASGTSRIVGVFLESRLKNAYISTKKSYE
jgi:prepilin-type N-terminal cleavage/methylation domain-containing protein